MGVLRVLVGLSGLLVLTAGSGPASEEPKASRVPEPPLAAKDSADLVHGLGDATPSSRCADDDQCLRRAWGEYGSKFKKTKCKSHKNRCSSGKPRWSAMRDCCPETCGGYTCNKAMCAGRNQPTSPYRGGLDCSIPGGKAWNSQSEGWECPDNLSTMKYYAPTQMGSRDGRRPLQADIEQGHDGVCYDFNGNYALKRVAIGNNAVLEQAAPGQQMSDAIVTKAAVYHPDKAHVKVGWMALKRIVCSPEEGNSEGGSVQKKCDVFKNFVCIRCQEEIFVSGRGHPHHRPYWSSNHSTSFMTTTAELQKFANECAAHAWDNAGTATAKVKDSYKCTDADMTEGLTEVLAY